MRTTIDLPEEPDELDHGLPQVSVGRPITAEDVRSLDKEESRDAFL